MKVPTGDNHYDNFFYIRGVLHKAFDHIGIAGTKCGIKWTTEDNSISVVDSPQWCIDTYGDSWGGLTLCRKCFGGQTIKHFKNVEARLLKAKAKRLEKKAEELEG